MTVETGSLRRLLLSMGSVTGVTLVTLGSYMLAMMILGRTLPKSGFGFLALWVYGFNILGAASLTGFNNAVLRNYPRRRLAESDWRRLMRRLAVLGLGVCTAGAVVFAAVYDASPWSALCLGVAAYVAGLSLFPVTLLQIFGRFAVAQGIFTLWRPVLLVGAVALWAVGGTSVRFLVAAAALGALLQFLLALLALRHVPSGTARMPMGRLAPDAFAFAGLFLAAMLLLRLDAFFLPKLLGLDALALYTAIGFLPMTGYGIVSVALGQVLNPKLANREKVPLGALTVFLLAGGGLVGAILALAANHLVPLAFGGAYTGDHRLVTALLAVAGILQVAYAIPSGRVGILASRTILRAFLILSLTSIAVDAALLFWAVPRWGLPGAAAATAGTWAWRTGTAWWVASRTTRAPGD